jgi:hypothetical protein
MFSEQAATASTRTGVLTARTNARALITATAILPVNAPVRTGTLARLVQPTAIKNTHAITTDTVPTPARAFVPQGTSDPSAV